MIRKPASRSTGGSVRSTAMPATMSCPSAVSASFNRSTSLRWSSSVGSDSSRKILRTLGSRMTRRPSPIVAALGTRSSCGTSHVMSSYMRVWHERRQPSEISAGRSNRWSAVSASDRPSTTLTLHFPQVPRPPQVESMGRPIQCAALNSVVPGGTRVMRSNGRYLTSSLRWITSYPWGSRDEVAGEGPCARRAAAAWSAR